MHATTMDSFDPVASAVPRAMEFRAVPWPVAARHVAQRAGVRARVGAWLHEVQSGLRASVVAAFDLGAWRWLNDNAAAPLLAADSDEEIARVLSEETPRLMQFAAGLVLVRGTLLGRSATPVDADTALQRLRSVVAEQLGDDMADAVHQLARGWGRAMRIAERLGSEAGTVDISVPIARWIWILVGLSAAATGTPCTAAARGWLLRTAVSLGDELYRPLLAREIELEYARNDAADAAGVVRPPEFASPDVEALLADGERFEAAVAADVAGEA